MKRFFIQLIIFSLMLTAPLSFTGDRCPDFKPDCSRNRYIAEAIAVSIAQRHTKPSKAEPLCIPPAFTGSTTCLAEPVDITHPQQNLIESYRGRAPPRLHTASA